MCGWFPVIKVLRGLPGRLETFEEFFYIHLDKNKGIEILGLLI